MVTTIQWFQLLLGRFPFERNLILEAVIMVKRVRYQKQFTQKFVSSIFVNKTDNLFVAKKLILDKKRYQQTISLH